MAKETLWDQLDQIFPEILPKDPEKSITGTILLKEVRQRLTDTFSDDSIRAYFSYMAQDPATKIAKRAGGHGYYLRTDVPAASSTADSAETSKPLASEDEPTSGGRDTTPEEKFRAIFMRYSELTTLQFPMKIEHTESKKGPAGQHKWKFPDVVLLKWAAGRSVDEIARLDPNLLAAMGILGEPPFTLQSVELKVALSLSSARQVFFQCLSNSRWAHRSTLVVAANVEDEILQKELERLGASYDVSVVSFGLSESKLACFPSADVIHGMSLVDFDHQIASQINETRICTSADRNSLDWETIKDLQSISGDFNALFAWIAYCLDEKKALSFAGFQRVLEILNQA